MFLSGAKVIQQQQQELYYIVHDIHYILTPPKQKQALSLSDSSKAVFLLWIFYVFVLSCVCFVFVRICLYVLCGHLLRKGWPLGSRLWCLTVSLSLSHWYPGSGVVLDCIDSWSLHPYLLRCAIFSLFTFFSELGQNEHMLSQTPMDIGKLCTNFSWFCPVDVMDGQTKLFSHPIT